MIKYFCDKCGKEIGDYYYKIEIFKAYKELTKVVAPKNPFGIILCDDCGRAFIDSVTKGEASDEPKEDEHEFRTCSDCAQCRQDEDRTQNYNDGYDGTYTCRRTGCRIGNPTDYPACPSFDPYI